MGHCPEVIGPVILGNFGHFLDFVPVEAVNDAQHHKVVFEKVITWTEYVLYSHMSVRGSFGSLYRGHWSGSFGTFWLFSGFCACRGCERGAAPQSRRGKSHNLDGICLV